MASARQANHQSHPTPAPYPGEAGPGFLRPSALGRRRHSSLFSLPLKRPDDLLHACGQGLALGVVQVGGDFAGEVEVMAVVFFEQGVAGGGHFDDIGAAVGGVRHAPDEVLGFQAVGLDGQGAGGHAQAFGQFLHAQGAVHAQDFQGVHLGGGQSFAFDHGGLPGGQFLVKFHEQVGQVLVVDHAKSSGKTVTAASVA